jgi:hypothetical protein
VIGLFSVIEVYASAAEQRKQIVVTGYFAFDAKSLVIS